MADEEILSSEEKEAIQEAVEQTPVEELTPSTSQANVLDFAHIQNTTNKYPGLQTVIDLFNLEFANQTTQFLKRKTTVNLAHFQFDAFGPYCQREPSLIYNLIMVKSHKLYAIITVPYELLSYLLLNLFGGNYSANEPSFQGIGKTGQKIVNRLLNLIFTSLKTVWSEVVAFEFELVKSYTNPNIITKIHRNDIFAISRSHLKFFDFSSSVDILLPSALLDRLKEPLKRGGEKNSDRLEENQWKEALKKEVLTAPIELKAILPQIQMTLLQVLNLKEGDVIPISDPRYVSVQAGNATLFRAIAGITGEQRVIKISDSY